MVLTVLCAAQVCGSAEVGEEASLFEAGLTSSAPLPRIGHHDHTSCERA